MEESGGEQEWESVRGYRYLQPSFARCQEKLIRDCTAGVTATPRALFLHGERGVEREIEGGRRGSLGRDRSFTPSAACFLSELSQHISKIRFPYSLNKEELWVWNTQTQHTHLNIYPSRQISVHLYKSQCELSSNSFTLKMCMKDRVKSIYLLCDCAKSVRRENGLRAESFGQNSVSKQPILPV